MIVVSRTGLYLNNTVTDLLIKSIPGILRISHDSSFLPLQWSSKPKERKSGGGNSIPTAPQKADTLTWVWMTVTEGLI